VAPGAAVDRENVLFTIADLSTVWIDFAIYPQHIGLVRRGQTVKVHSRSGPDLTATGTVSYVGPLLEQDTRVSYGRVVVQNADGRWQAGVYVTATITVDFAEAKVAVPETAIIRSKFGPAVFRASGATFELQPIEPGRTDGSFTEVLAGLEPGSFVVTQNAFLLKAELGKSEAHHDH
jgi:cobalt-zinc-cadmium efflux system membrane fusion protein